MSNSSIDNKLNEINDRNRQNPQNEPDEEENMSGFEKGRLAALNAKYEDDDEPKNQNGNDGGSEEEEAPEDENDEEDNDDDNDEDKDDDDDDDDDDNDKENDNDDKNNDNENNNKPNENENKPNDKNSDDKNSDDKENSDKPDSKENKKEKDSKNQNNKEPQSPTDNKKPAEKPQTPKAGQAGAKEGTKQAGKEGAKQAGKEGAKQAGKEGAKQVGKEGAKQAGKEGAKQAGKEGAKQAAKAGAKAAAKAGTKVAAKAGIAASPPVLIAILVIVAIIFLIGVISFFSIMGDMIIGKIKGFLQGVWDALETVFTGDQAEAKINDEQVKNAASYLEQMGYDLVGMGFVKTEYNTTNKNEGEPWNKWYNENGELIEEGSSNKKDLIERDTTEDEAEGEKSGAEQKDPINKIKSEPIRKYLVASLRSYINGTYGGMVVQEGHENDGLWDTIFDNIAFNSKEHTLTVTKGDTHVKVNLESWTAKYGMAYEFLVCLHIGTLAPEFVMELAGDANDRVKVVVNFYEQERNKKI
jgi:hypothetical protein